MDENDKQQALEDVRRLFGPSNGAWAEFGEHLSESERPASTTKSDCLVGIQRHGSGGVERVTYGYGPTFTVALSRAKARLDREASRVPPIGSRPLKSLRKRVGFP